MDIQNMIDVKDAAVKLELTEERVRDLINEGRLKAVKIGRKWKITPKDLELFFESRISQSEVKEDVVYTGQTLTFTNLQPMDFTKMCYWLVDSDSKYKNVDMYDGPGDKQRDVIAEDMKGDKYYFQCKRYKSISYSDFEKEINKIIDHVEKDKKYKPDEIIFVTACSVSAQCKDEVKEYVGKNSLGRVNFWTNVVLDKKVKLNPDVKNEFFKSGISANEVDRIIMGVVDKVTENINLTPQIIHPAEISEKDPLLSGYINDEIDRAVDDIHSENIESAKNKLFEILGQVESQKGDYKKELNRIYNNLGVCFNRPEFVGGDYNKAKKFFERALENDSKFMQARINLVSTYLNLEGEENEKMAYDLAKDIWESSTKDNALYIQNYFWAIYLHKSLNDLIDFYEQNAEVQNVVLKDYLLMCGIGLFYLEYKNIDKAEELADNASKIASAEPEVKQLKGRILMAKALKEDVLKNDMIPKLKDYENIENALAILEDAYNTAKQKNKILLIEQIRIDITACLTMLKDVREKKYKDFRDSIVEDHLSEKQKDLMKTQDFTVFYERGEFDNALNTIVDESIYSRIPYSDKFHAAEMFLAKGAIEQARQLLVLLKEKAEEINHAYYWITLCNIEVLADNKPAAIVSAQKACDVANKLGDPEIRKKALSHYNALMLRYSHAGETDRLLTSVMKYEREFPDEKILQPIKAINEDGTPTEEIKNIFIKQKEWYENLKEQFRCQPVPTYLLEEFLRRTYVDILSSQNDPEFILEYTVPNKEFMENLKENFFNAEYIVLDYAALLNLSKMNLLGFLDSFSKKIMLTQELFYKIQFELLQYENAEARKLWNYLRTNKGILYYSSDNKMELEIEKVDIFKGYKWLISLMKTAKEKAAVFITDDLRLLKLAQHENVAVANTMTLLHQMRSNEWIDDKIFSISIGRLAERMYTFLSFNGDDLFHIVLDDEGKISLRSYHLVNQMFLPGSTALSFTNVFVNFLDKFWSTGSLPENKVEWIVLLSKCILKFIDGDNNIKDFEELKRISADLINMYIVVGKKGNKNEISLLLEKMDEVFYDDSHCIYKDNISKMLTDIMNSK